MMLQYLTNYEMNDHASNAAGMFKSYRGRFLAPPDVKMALDNFLKEYLKNLQEYVDEKRHAKELQQASLEATQRQADAERQSREESENAKAAAEKEAIAVQERAASDARAAVREARQKKLDEILASPAYKIYLSALKIEEGEKLIHQAQAALNYDDKVTENSSVTDLTLRRGAGEDMEAGKKIVEDEFPIYKKLGGTAATPDEVHAGPDPAADYR
jgi:hypothetical protein